MCPKLEQYFKREMKGAAFRSCFDKEMMASPAPGFECIPTVPLTFYRFLRYIRVLYFDKLHLFRIYARLFRFVLEAIVSCDLLLFVDRLSFYLFRTKIQLLKPFSHFALTCNLYPVIAYYIQAYVFWNKRKRAWARITGFLCTVELRLTSREQLSVRFITIF